MSIVMELLRGPVLGVILVIFLLAGAIIITAFAALVAQMGLLFRLKAWNTPARGNPAETPAEPTQSTVRRQSRPTAFQGSPQVVDFEPNGDEVVDGVWWMDNRQI